MLSTGLGSYDVRVPMDDVGLCMLDLPASESVVHHDPGDRVSFPVKPLVILNDCEIHRHEHPWSRRELALDPANYLRIGTSRGAKITNGVRFDAAPSQSGEEMWIFDLLVEDEKRHVPALQAEGLVGPPHRLV